MADLATIASSAATTLVTAMATDVWSGTRALFAGLWKARPHEAQRVLADLDKDNDVVSRARERQDAEAEELVAAEWEIRLRRVLTDSPDALAMLRSVLAGSAALTTGNTVTMRAKATGHGQNYQSAGDMEINK